MKHDWTRTSALAALGQVRHCRAAALPFAALCGSPRFRFASAYNGQPTGLTLISAPHDVRYICEGCLDRIQSTNIKKKNHSRGVVFFLVVLDFTRSSALAALGQVRHCRAAALPFAALCGSPRFRFASAYSGQPTGLTLISAPHRCVHIFTGVSGQVKQQKPNKKPPCWVVFCLVVLTGLEPVTPSM